MLKMVYFPKLFVKIILYKEILTQLRFGFNLYIYFIDIILHI